MAASKSAKESALVTLPLSEFEQLLEAKGELTWIKWKLASGKRGFPKTLKYPGGNLLMAIIAQPSKPKTPKKRGPAPNPVIQIVFRGLREKCAADKGPKYGKYPRVADQIIFEWAAPTENRGAIGTVERLRRTYKKRLISLMKQAHQTVK